MTNVPPIMRTATRLLPVLAMVSCAIGGDTDEPTIESLLSGTASVSLTGSSTRVSLTTDSEWSLSKTGSLSGNTVTWNITATKTATTSGHLVLQGQMTVTNTGNGPATIGNIVVNLQKRVSNKWVTASSNIANATQGGAATTANIHKAASSEGKATFSENSASGSLEFMDASNNTLFSLVPQALIGASETRTLLFSASFNNNDAALNLAPGTAIRAEVIVTFGNATQNGNSTANLDINGNGVIDADEARVRSVPSRLGVTVPPAVNGNTTPTLTDTNDDIDTTGTVSFTNAQFNLGPTGGTVTATVNGGAQGGTITNCAHLTSPDQTVTSGGNTFTTVQGINLMTCSQVQVGPVVTCQPGQVGCRWRTGDLVTRTQVAWDSTTSWYAAYDAVYASTFGTVEIGIPGTSGFSLRFGAGTRINEYFVQSGAPAALDKDLDDTTSSSSGVFGGEVLALRLNVDFSAAAQLGGSSGISFGSLTLCAMSDASLNSTSVSDLLGVANTLLGGGSVGSYTISAINTLVTELNFAFLDGTPSIWANAHLYNGPCP